MSTLKNNEMNEPLNNLKSFKFYIEHIIESIENNNYNKEMVIELSEYIKMYYNKVNNEDRYEEGQSKDNEYQKKQDPPKEA